MKGRDKRRRAVSRTKSGRLQAKPSKAAKESMASLRRCKVLVALIDESTCMAEQRFNQAARPNVRCDDCQYFVKLLACKLTGTDIHKSVCEAGRDELSCARCGYFNVAAEAVRGGVRLLT
jgi:hypothetical protein